MKSNFVSSVSGRRSLVIWALFCIIAAATLLSYVFTSLANGHGELIMPLDDVYIHFQYARQMAAGQPYIYNPGLAATSGATSFLYPYILAIGYLIGFQGLQLGLWAMAVGALALVCAMWLVYKLVQVLGAGDVMALLVAVAFGTNGSVAWHFMSGMETGLVILFTFGTLYAVITSEGNRLWRVVIWTTLLALIRPEGGLLAVVAVGAVLWKVWERRGGISTKPPRMRRWLLLIPVLAVGVQPIVNLVLTGSAVASGNAAKSVLGAVPFHWDEVIRRIVENFVRMWVEFGTGISPREGLYILPLLLLLAVIGIGLLLIIRATRPVGVMLVLWLVGGTLMLATLDTAFWHFKRYQMPFTALLFPLAGWGMGVVGSFKFQVKGKYAVEPPTRQERQDLLPQRHRDAESTSRSLFRDNLIGFVVIGGMLIVNGVTSIQFLRYYGQNVGYVYQQPLQMARWLESNTPLDAVVAVHDVGMMRYMGGRTTLDMVGLTTKGAADYWRNGPGAVAEFLMQEKPDYIASYGDGHGYGLGMIAQTDIYGTPLASFPVELDDTANVALAANYQGIYKSDWNLVENRCCVMQSSLSSSLNLAALRKEFGTVGGDILEVGNITSEQAHHYQWMNHTEDNAGFATEVHEFSYPNCYDYRSAFYFILERECRLVDAGRSISGEESFTIGYGFGPISEYDGVLITRVHPAAQGTFDILINGTFFATRVIPEMRGQWLDIPTLIPRLKFSNPMQIQIIPHISDGYYMPYKHGLYPYQESPLTTSTTITTFQNSAIQLAEARLDYKPDEAKLDLNLDWYTDGSATGDYKVFVHLYNDVNEPPVAQMDLRPGNGTLPPGNWLPGVLHDTITVDLSGVPAGQYQVAIGLYDPVTFERLEPTGGDEQERLFIGEVEIN